MYLMTRFRTSIYTTFGSNRKSAYTNTFIHFWRLKETISFSKRFFSFFRLMLIFFLSFYFDVQFNGNLYNWTFSCMPYNETKKFSVCKVQTKNRETVEIGKMKKMCACHNESLTVNGKRKTVKNPTDWMKREKRKHTKILKELSAPEFTFRFNWIYAFFSLVYFFNFFFILFSLLLILLLSIVLWIVSFDLKFRKIALNGNLFASEIRFKLILIFLWLQLTLQVKYEMLVPSIRINILAYLVRDRIFVFCSRIFGA